MLRIGKLTDYATVILATLAADRARLQNAGTLAERTHIAAPTVSKLLKQLHRAGLVNSTRGTHGGYQLARDPEAISAAAILDALEGPSRSPSARPAAAIAASSTPAPSAAPGSGSTSRSAARSAKSRWRSSPAWTAGRPTMPIERELKLHDAGAKARHEQRAIHGTSHRRAARRRATGTASSPTSNPTRCRRGSTRTWCASSRARRREPRVHDRLAPARRIATG